MVEYALRDQSAPDPDLPVPDRTAAAPCKDALPSTERTRHACATSPQLVRPLRHKYRQTAPETVWLLGGG